MNIRRLGWAGIEIEAAGGRAVIDLMESFVRDVGAPLPPPSAPGAVSLALVTHLHRDHADPDAIARALSPDGVLLRPAPTTGDKVGTAGPEQGFLDHGLTTRSVEVWQSVTVGPFTATAVPAVDGVGDPQVSWVVEADGQRILHCGDTMFHGAWWEIRDRLGPIDAAFLPINGAVINLPFRQPASTLGAAMDPRQAVEATVILGAGFMVPIHYDGMHNPPGYVQVDHPADTLRTVAEERGVRAVVIPPGDPVPALGEPASVDA